jgi:putative DNA-invertase from lambdoid prophage Rac
MSHLAYFRVSGPEQSIASQRHAMLANAAAGQFSEEFADEGVSGATPASQRPAFARLLAYARKGDVIHVYAVDRLGRDALDVQSTVRALLDKGVAVEVHGLGRIARGVGELILAVLAQVADMERRRIQERTEAGRAKARASLDQTGRTHRGKASMGRPADYDPIVVAQWRLEHSASITATAEHFGCSPATVKRCCAAAVDA